MNCLIVDDEPLAIELIEDFAGKIPFLKSIKTCTSSLEALEIAKTENIDLIFLDIQMPHLSGIEFLNSLENKPLIIFTTAYSNYALDGFNLNATDYLLKPFAFDRFVKAVNKAYEIFQLKLSQKQDDQVIFNNNFILVKADYSTVKIDLSEILYIEGLKDYLKIYVENKKTVITRNTMKNIEAKLPSKDFIRVHKSFIISRSKLESIEKNRIVIGKKYIPIGDSYKTEFYNSVRDVLL